MKANIAILAVWLCCIVAQADQIRIAVGQAEVVAETEKEKAEAAGLAALWQSLLSLELAKADLFAVVDRDDLPLVLREFEMVVSTNAARAPTLLAADCVLISKWEVQRTKHVISVRVVSTAKAGVEKEFVRSISTATMDVVVQELAKQLKGVALEMLSQRSIHTAVSILDYESLSPFERGKWQERAIARRLRASLQRQPGVLVLERENMDQLLAEARLAVGGLTKAQPGAMERWANLTNHLLISGTVDESQREGEPLTFKTVTQIRNLESGMTEMFRETYAVGDADEGVARIERQVGKVIWGRDGRTTNAIAETDRSSEALTLANKALRLANAARDVQNLDAIKNYKLQIPPQFFSASRHPGDMSPERRAAVLQAVQYLKAALLVEDRNPAIKNFLIAMLRDRQVQDIPLALELAEELGWQVPDQQAPAWCFLFQNMPGARGLRYRQMLMDKHPGTYEAKLAAHAAMLEAMEKHRTDADQTEGIFAARPYFDKALAWSPNGWNIDGEIFDWFRFTQIKRGKELRDPAARAPGLKVIEETMQQRPEWAFWICHAWSLACESLSEGTTCEPWLRRTLALAADTEHGKDGVVVRADIIRTKLARNALAEQKPDEAKALLQSVTAHAYQREAQYLLAWCAYESGDFEKALAEFRSLASYRSIIDASELSASEWAARCEEKLAARGFTRPSLDYTVTARTGAWQKCSIALPQGVIHAMKRDGDDIWIGLQNWMVWSDHNLVMLENDPTQMEKAMKSGGLVRFNRRSGTTTRFEVGKTISHPWVTSIAITDGRVWIGTLGKGIDVFDKETSQWSNMSERDGLPSNFIQCLDADAGNLWVGTGRFSHGGVARFNFKSRQWRSFLPADYSGKTAPPTNHVACVKSVNGRVWFGMREALAAYDEERDRWQYIRSPNHFTAIEACAGRIWFGANQYNSPTPKNGLLNCNLSGEDWQTLSREDGLPDFRIYALAEQNGRLLIGSHGLMILQPREKNFFAYDMLAKIPAAKWDVAPRSLLVVDDEIWIGASGEVLKMPSKP